MAQQFSSSIYRYKTADLMIAQGVPAVQGVLHSFPSQGVRTRPVHGSVKANGITMNSIISLLPQGLNQAETDFYTPDTVATLVTAANA